MHVRVWPPFYNRLDEVCSLDQQLEIISRHLEEIKKTFAEQWDTLPNVPGRGPEWRFVNGEFDGSALFAILARQCDDDTVEIRAVRVVNLPA